MIKEFKYLFYIIIIFFFFFFSIRYYFSNDNYKKSYRTINSIDKKINLLEKDLIFLQNNTENILEYVEYKSDKRKKKYSFWELLYNEK